MYGELYLVLVRCVCVCLLCVFVCVSALCVSAINVCTCMRVSFGSRFRCTFHSSSSAFNYLQEEARERERGWERGVGEGGIDRAAAARHLIRVNAIVC